MIYNCTSIPCSSNFIHRHRNKCSCFLFSARSSAQSVLGLWQKGRNAWSWKQCTDFTVILRRVDDFKRQKHIQFSNIIIYNGITRTFLTCSNVLLWFPCWQCPTSNKSLLNRIYRHGSHWYSASLKSDEHIEASNKQFNGTSIY